MIKSEKRTNTHDMLKYSRKWLNTTDEYNRHELFFFHRFLSSRLLRVSDQLNIFCGLFVEWEIALIKKHYPKMFFFELIFRIKIWSHLLNHFTTNTICIICILHMFNSRVNQLRFRIENPDLFVQNQFKFGFLHKK